MYRERRRSAVHRIDGTCSPGHDDNRHSAADDDHGHSTVTADPEVARDHHDGIAVCTTDLVGHHRVAARSRR